MQTELIRIGAKLQGNSGSSDYVVWCHEKEEEVNPGNSCSIFGPDEIEEAGDYDALYVLTCERITEMSRSLSDS